MNLTAATRIFIFEPQWNPSVERQAIARAIRIGQEKSVHVTRYVIKNTVEQVRDTEVDRNSHLEQRPLLTRVQEILGQQIKKRKAAALGSKVEDGTRGGQQGLTAPHTIKVV